MRDFVLITLWGPLCSWGGVTAGGRRETGRTPTRSALLGLLAAALGVAREDTQALGALSKALSIGTRVEHPGGLLRDFHTTQVGQGKAARDLTTRSDELTWNQPEKIETILSSRDYLTDAVYTAGFWCEADEGGPDLNTLRDALQAPRWHLSLGRKSCVMGIPMLPRVYQAPTFRHALEQRQEPSKDPILGRIIGGRTPERRRVVWQGQHGGYDVGDERTRRDEPGDRSRWQFYTRNELRGWHMTRPNKE